MLRPFKIWTQYQSFIVYANNAETLQDYVPQKIIRSRACFSWYDKLIRFAQRFFIPIRIRKYEYIHLLEVIGQAHVTTNLTQQLNNILSAPHSRHFRYQLCEFLHQLKLGHPLPLSFACSFDSLTQHVALLKNPAIQRKINEITPFIIKGLETQISSQMKIYSTLIIGLIILSGINAAAYIVANTEFTRQFILKSYFRQYIHPFSTAFIDVFKTSTPSSFNLKLSVFVLFLLMLNFASKLPILKPLFDMIKIKTPIVRKLVWYRDATQVLFTISLSQKLSLDHSTTCQLCLSQINNTVIKNRWQSYQNNAAIEQYIHILFSKVFEPTSLTLSNCNNEIIAQTFDLAEDEVNRRQKNIVLLSYGFVSSSLIALCLWFLMAYFGFRGELFIYR